ncbi:hypothetical protein DW110_13410 [Phocaeicola plebeius]|nr:hypothetical protein DW110_13410 [Phocaeicola plebeius]
MISKVDILHKSSVVIDFEAEKISKHCQLGYIPKFVYTILGGILVEIEVYSELCIGILPKQSDRVSSICH